MQQQKASPWRPILILAIIGLCVLALLQKGLKPGMDLAGGFVLTYDVEVPEGQEPAAAVEQIIQVLSNRVDPTGVRNLVWRRQGSNRLEIQSALAPAKVRVMRDAYLAAFDALKTGNVSRYQLESTLRDPAQRQKDFDALAGDNESRTKLLKNLATAYDAMEAARVPYEEAVKNAAKAQENLDKLPPDAPEDQKKQMADHVKTMTAALTEKTKAYFEARSKFEPAMSAVLSMNLSATEVERVLNLPSTFKTPDGAVTNPREDGFKKLKTEHPDRAAKLQAVADTHAEYAANRGPLDDPEDLISMLRGSGVLEFRIAPQASNAALNIYRDQLREKGPNTGKDREYLWFPIDDISAFADNEGEKKELEANPAGYFASRRNLVGERYGDKYYLLLSNHKNERISAAEEGWKLADAGPTRDRSGFPAISFSLNTVGGQLLGAMTEANLGQLMTIILDGRATNAATIQSRIDGDGQLSKGGGGYGKKEMDYLLRTLKAGSLKATLADRPSSIQFFQAEAGQENLERGLTAFGISAAIVVAFMIVYYFGWGVVAVVALAFNLIIILGVMSLLENAFTMAGIAGVVLTIGMAVDANVLIFERIREELSRGANVKTAVRLGFDKALSTIMDSNITTLITCFVLGYFATADVRGFTITLGIGLVANVFTAVFCSRTIIDWWLKLKDPTTAPMLPTKYAKIQKALTPNIDWMGKRKTFQTISVVAAVIGLGVFFGRGEDMLDIEFRSGTQVGFKLADGKTVTRADAVQRLDKIAKANNLPALARGVSSVQVVGALGAKNEAGEFKISVLDQDKERVSGAIKDAFSDVLNVERAIHFKGDGTGDKPADGEAIESSTGQRLPDFVTIIRSDTLGESIGRESGVKVNDYIGGVAITLDGLNPPVSTAELTDRIKRQRSQAKYERLGNRDFRVIGLDQATGAQVAEGQGQVYKSAVVVVTDGRTNYAEDPSSFVTDLTGLSGTEWNLVHDALLRDSSLDSVSSFDSQVSGTMKRQAIVALLLSMFAICIYVWIRFGTLRYGAGAIIAIIHDVSIVVGCVGIAGLIYDTPIGPMLGLMDFKINLTMVAAILTVVGYSINDTIVVFDRIRENRGRLATVNESIINDAINQTVSRTILTGLTTLMALAVLYLFGGEAVRGFAFSLFIGVVVGTYSSIAIASPLLLGKSFGATDEGTAVTKPAA